MTYSLERLAPGSYDVLLDGEVVASLVRIERSEKPRFRWFAELLSEEPTKRPAPFVKPSHAFDSLTEACEWLGVEAPVGRPRLDQAPTGKRA